MYRLYRKKIINFMVICLHTLHIFCLYTAWLFRYHGFCLESQHQCYKEVWCIMMTSCISKSYGDSDDEHFTPETRP